MAEVKLDEAAKSTGTKQEGTANKTVTYICKTKCFYDGVLYREGETITTKDKKLPEHFEKVE